MAIAHYDNSDRKPWEKQRGESVHAYAGFSAYRDLGPERSLAKAAKELGKSLSLVETWSGRDGWVKRVEAWDAEVERRILEEQTAQEARDRREARGALRKVRKRLLTKLQRWVDTMEPEAIKLSELLKALELLDKLERLDNNDPTEISKTIDTDTASPEEIIELLKTGVEKQRKA